MNKEERGVLEETRKIDQCDMEEYCTLDSMEEFNVLDISEKAIAILGDRMWPQVAKQEGDTAS